jgi:hypothetical protein
MNRQQQPEIKWTGPEQKPAPVPGNPKCPLCTTILHNESRRGAMAANLRRLVRIEQEHKQLLMIVYALLRERGGELVVRHMPTLEEAGLYNIEYRSDEDGALRIRATALVAVKGDES